MNDIYKKLKKANDSLIKETNGEYAIFLNELVKTIRKYAIKSQSTESKLKTIIEEIIVASQNNIRFSTFIPNKKEYIESKKSEFVKGNNKPKYTVKEIITIVTILTIFFGLAIAGFILERPVDFETPKNVKVEEGIFYFDEVKYAKEYVIRCYSATGKVLREIYLDDEDPEVVNTMRYNLTNITELKQPGTYLIKVKVITNGIYQDSKWSKECTYVNVGYN